MINKKILYIPGLYIASSSIFLISLLLYRVEIFFLIKGIYPQFKDISFWGYLSNTGIADAAVILSLLIILYLLSIAPGKSVKAGSIVTIIILSSLHLFLIKAANFFRIYETAFSRKFWASEITTGLGELIGSAIAETPVSLYIKAFAGIVLITLIIIKFPQSIERLKTGKPGADNGLVLSQLTLLLFLAGLAVMPDSSFNRGENRSDHILFKEISGNPLFNLFISRDLQIDNIAESIPEGEFQFGLNTESLVNPRLHRRINNIPRGKEYNIILYFFESTPMAYFDLEINGEKVLPNWHRLKKNALFATNHYANFPLSANAMLSAFTSAYSHHSKDLVVQKYSSIKLNSITEILRKNGYTTSVVHTGDLRYAGQRRFLSYRGIDRIIDLPELEEIPPYNYKVGWGVDERAMTAPSIEFLKNRGDKPFFIKYMPVNPHHPYAIPDGFKQITGPVPSGIDYKKRNWLHYLNSLHYADYCLGELIDSLEKEGLMENTILFLVADHGEAFYQHPQNYNHPFFLYDVNVHVPFMIYSKEFFTEPLVYDGVSSHIDIPVTMLDILGIQKDKKHEGKSILSSHKEQLAFLHTFWKDDYCGIRDGKWKYIRRMDNGLEELYNLETDPEEMKNIKDNHPELTDKFRNYILNAREYQVNFYHEMLSDKRKSIEGKYN